MTVTSATRRVDLALPAAVPVAELMPALARAVGLLDATTVHGGYRLVTSGGCALDVESGLAGQGVEDGGVITMTAGVDLQSPVYDDVVEAMADVVEQDALRWESASARHIALLAAVLLLLPGVAGLVLQHGSETAGIAASLVAMALVLGAVTLSRLTGESGAAVAIAWTACAYAAAAGMLLGPPASFLGTPFAAAGAGAVLAGLAAAVGLAVGRILLVPPVVGGALLATAGLLTRASSYDPAVALTATLTLVVSTGSVLPWLALAATGPSVGRHLAVLDTTVDPRDIDSPEVDLERVRADARSAHEVLVALSATVGLVLVLVAPAAVSLGPAGALLVLLCCAVVMLRTRRYLSAAHVVTGLASGVLGLLSTAASVLWLLPSWRPAVSLVAAVVGALLLVVIPRPRGSSVRGSRLGDLAETGALLALPPVLVVASGVLGSIAG